MADGDDARILRPNAPGRLSARDVLLREYDARRRLRSSAAEPEPTRHGAAAGALSCGRAARTRLGERLK